MKTSAINVMSIVPSKEHVLGGLDGKAVEQLALEFFSLELQPLFEWFRQTLGSRSISAEVLDYEYAEVAGCCPLKTLVVYSD